MFNRQLLTIRLCRKPVKDETRLLRLLLLHTQTRQWSGKSMIVLLVKVSATKKAEIVKRKKHSYFYLWKSLKVYSKFSWPSAGRAPISNSERDRSQAVRQDQSQSAIGRRPSAAACHSCTCHVVAFVLAPVHECAPIQTLLPIVQMVY